MSSYPHPAPQQPVPCRRASCTPAVASLTSHTPSSRASHRASLLKALPRAGLSLDSLLILSSPTRARNPGRAQRRVARHALETLLLVQVEQVASFCGQCHRLRVVGLFRYVVVQSLPALPSPARDNKAPGLSADGPLQNTASDSQTTRSCAPIPRRSRHRSRAPTCRSIPRPQVPSSALTPPPRPSTAPARSPMPIPRSPTAA